MASYKIHVHRRAARSTTDSMPVLANAETYFVTSSSINIIHRWENEVKPLTSCCTDRAVSINSRLALLHLQGRVPEHA